MDPVQRCDRCGTEMVRLGGRIFACPECVKGCDADHPRAPEVARLVAQEESRRETGGD